jgi:hypothetical protein
MSSASPSSALLTSIQHLGPCQVGALRSMDTSRGHLPAGHPVASRRWQRHAAHQRRALHAMWTSMCYVHGLCFGPRRARRCLITRVDIRAELGRRVVAGEPPQAVPRHASYGPASADCGPHCPVWHYGRAAVGRACTVRVGHAPFQPSSHLELENSFSIVHSISNQILTLKICI